MSQAPVPARRGFPLVPTLMVVIAIPLMLALGIWQYQRHLWKDALLASYAANAAAPRLRIAGAIPPGNEFRRVALNVDCAAGTTEEIGGANREGAAGFAHLRHCTAGAQAILLDIGWSARPQTLRLPASTALVRGRLGTQTPQGWRLTAEQPTAPLLASATPTRDSIPNNHLSYALQWWSFAAILAVIYAIWLRRWLAPGGRPA